MIFWPLAAQNLYRSVLADDTLSYELRVHQRVAQRVQHSSPIRILAVNTCLKEDGARNDEREVALSTTHPTWL